ncbi:MAG TPA: uracil-DNA glycosylase [Gammaproteobacteria bacterium]|nr:uracil-DNA glycosylase [Gammaproteobacteria bacterium]
MNTEQIRYMQAMGIQPWHLKNKENHLDDWEPLKQAVIQCTACGLDKTRTQTVFGVGNRHARLMVIGEAPGFHEDQQGEPFVGRAGLLLNAMLESVGLNRSTVYIANILKCRPPNNRDPLPEEVELCTPFLTKQIALINPVLLLAVGRIAAQFLLNTKTSLGQLRGKIHTYGQSKTPLIITYHPAYLLRNPSDKRKAFQDLRQAQKLLDE